MMLTLHSYAQEWTHVGQSDDGAVQIFLKESSVKDENGYFSCRVKTTTSPNYQISLRISREKSVVGYENYNHSLYIHDRLQNAEIHSPEKDGLYQYRNIA